MLASYRLLSERSQVRLLPGARSNSTNVHPATGAGVANRSASGLRKTIARTFGHNLLVVLALASVLAFGLATQDKESVARPAVVNANTLIAEHGCTNQDDPTHAVVTVDGRTRYVGQRLTN